MSDVSFFCGCTYYLYDLSSLYHHFVAGLFDVFVCLGVFAVLVINVGLVFIVRCVFFVFVTVCVLCVIRCSCLICLRCLSCLAYIIRVLHPLSSSVAQGSHNCGKPSPDGAISGRNTRGHEHTRVRRVEGASHRRRPAPRRTGRLLLEQVHHSMSRSITQARMMRFKE